MSDDAGFFRNLGAYAREYVTAKRRALQDDPAPETAVDSTSAGTGYSFSGQEIDFEDLRDIKDMRESGGQVAQLMDYKALLNFGEGAEIHVENNEATEEVIDGTPMTLEEWLELQFPRLDLTVLDLGSDALWYPAAVGELRETQAGDFKEFLPAEPWTVLPVTNDRGEIIAWKQQVLQNGTRQEQTLNADVLSNIVLNKQSARDKTGISEVLRNEDEITAFKENEQAINNAIELHGFPQRHVKVGREEGAPVRDDDLRRVRTLFDPHSTDANTAYFTGQDVDVESLEAENFDYQAIHEMDMRNLTTALGLPLEAGNVGADGLGSGKPAELRFALLKLAIKANQRSFSTQFVEKVIRPVIRDYSPFDHTARVTVEIDDPLEDIGETADLIQKVGDYMTNDEVRRKLDLPEPEDDEIGESFQSPAQAEAPEDEGGPLGGGEGLFRDGADGRALAEVPDNAVSISDRSEAPEGANVITGPGGGLYYVPSGEGDGGETSDGPSPSQIQDDVQSRLDSADDPFQESADIVSEATGVDDVTMPTADTREDLVQLTSTLAYAGEQGMMDPVEGIDTGPQGDAVAAFRANDNTLRFKENVGTAEMEGSAEEGQTVGDDLEWLVLHELGHAHHFEEYDSLDEIGEVLDTGMSVSGDGEWIGGDRVDLADEEVSSYGRTSHGEFVAEVFSGLAMGQDFSDDVLEIYDELDGPTNWEEYEP